MRVGGGADAYCTKTSEPLSSDILYITWFVRQGCVRGGCSAVVVAACRPDEQLGGAGGSISEEEMWG